MTARQRENLVRSGHLAPSAIVHRSRRASNKETAFIAFVLGLLLFTVAFNLGRAYTQPSGGVRSPLIQTIAPEL
jgi:hypothetical protein